MKILILLTGFLFLAFSSFCQWTQQESNTNSQLNDIQFINDTVGFIVGDGGIFLKTQNGGENWTLAVIQVNANFCSVSPVGDSILYAASNKGVHKSVDGGNTWNLINDDWPAYEVVFFNESTGYVKTDWYEECEAGWGGCHGTRYKYYKTVDGGQNWAASYTIDSYIVAGAIEMFSDSIAFFAGEHCDCLGSSYPCSQYNSALARRTTDGGQSWTALAEGPGRAYHTSSFVTPTLGYVIDHYGVTYLRKTTDGMETLDQVVSLFDEIPAKIDFATEYEGYYLKATRIMKTNSGGVLWTPDYIAGSNLIDMTITENYHAYVIGQNGIILSNILDPGTEPDSLYQLSINKDQLSFPHTLINNESIKQLTMTSSGNMDIYVSCIAPQGFKVKTEDDENYYDRIDSIYLRAFHDTIIDIAFVPTEAIEYSTSLEIWTNASNDTTYFIPMTGKGIIGQSGIISTDSVLCTDTVYISGNLTVNSGAKLTICPGTVVVILEKFAVEIYGSLEAIGDSANFIRFTTANYGTWHGLRIYGPGNDSTILEYCTIQNGYATESPYLNGGGLSISNQAHVRISHCQFSACNATSNGGGIYIKNASPLIEFCQICNNQADLKGGGIYCENSSALITGNQIHHNYCDFRGGGIHSYNSSIALINNCIYSNESGDNGGAIFIQQDFDDIETKVFQNLIFNNSSYRGGAIGIYHACAKIFNNTICNNYAVSMGGGLAAIADINLQIKGDIFYGNTQGQIIIQLDNTTVSYCDIQGGWTGPGTDNIDLDPEFIHPSSGTYILDSIEGLDWSIKIGSPCYNLGIPDTAGLGLPITDFGGYNRIYNGRTDIGAYEAFFACHIPDQEVCTGDTVKMEVVTSGEMPSFYQWMRNGEAIPSSDSNVIDIGIVSFEDSGNYQCMMICQGKEFLSNSATLTVIDGPPLIIDQPHGDILKEGERDTLKIIAQQAVSYQWYFNDNILAAETSNQYIIPAFSAGLQGTYRCYVENSCGGLFSDDAVLLLNTEGIDEQASQRWQVYPDPATWHLTVDQEQPSFSSHPSAIRIEISDFYGRTLIQLEPISSSPLLIDISSLPDGMYILKLISDDGSSQTAKFIKTSG